MATAILVQFEEQARDAHGNLIAAGDISRIIATERITYTTSTQSAVIDDRTTLLLLTMDGTKGHVAFGSSPTADNEDLLIPANGSQYFSIKRGIGGKIAIYDGSS